MQMVSHREIVFFLYQVDTPKVETNNVLALQYIMYLQTQQGIQILNPRVNLLFLTTPMVNPSTKDQGLQVFLEISTALHI
jgi:hypothetical protein